MIDREELKKLGFEEITHFTVDNGLIYQLGRDRHLSIGSLSTPNEVMFICGHEEGDNGKIKDVTDLVCIHNYDYDGYLTIEKVKKILDIF